MHTMKIKQSVAGATRQRRQRGLSLIEFMIAIVIGMLMLLGLTLTLVSSVQSRSELEKTSRQLENGRFAIEALREDIELAGFYGEFLPPSNTSWSTPDPCTTVLQDMGFAAPNYRWNTSSSTIIPVGIQGYTDATGLSCLSNYKANTSIIVIRRAGTVGIKIDADGNGVADAFVDTNGDGTTETAFADLGKGYLLQQSDCSDTPVESTFVMDHHTSHFTLHGVMPVVSGGQSSCKFGGLNTVRRYVQRIYYIGTCNDCSGAGDGIPTLKMVELQPASAVCADNTNTACGSTVTRSLADGIENLQLEYGIDASGFGTPDSFNSTPTAADWKNVVAVRIFLLARNNEKTAGYTDSKTYSLNSAGTALTGTPFADGYRRHVYSATARATNISGRRQL